MPSKIGSNRAAAAEPDGEPVSLRPSDQVSEGLIDDVTVTFKELTFVIWDYQGKADKPALAVKLVMDNEGEEFEQYYSAGSPDRFQPSEDGKTAIRVAGTGGLGNSTNAAALFRSIGEAGFPEDKMSSDLSCFEGLVAHVRRQAQQKRSGIQQSDDKQRTVLLVEKIIQMPWEKKGAKTAAKPVAGKIAGKVAAKAAPEETEEVAEDEEVDVMAFGTEILNEILSENKNKVKKSELPMKALKKLNDDTYKPHRKEILALFKDDDFLGSSWAFDKGVITPADE